MKEKYNDRRHQYYMAHKEKVRKLQTGVLNPLLVDYYMTRIEQPTPAADEDLVKWKRPENIRDKACKVAELAQKEVRKEWAHRGNVNNIIIIEHGTVNKSTMYYQCEIHQLRMDI